MAKLPEGRSALTDEQMIGLTHRLVDTCIDCKGKIEELEAKLAMAVERLGHIESMTVHSGGEIHGVTALHWRLAFDEVQDVARATIAELTNNQTTKGKDQ